MTDWADGIETRNYGIRSEIDADMLSELMRTIIPLVMIACALLFYSWVRSQIVNTGYESQSLSAAEKSLKSTQQRLKAEEAWLTSPEQIDIIARSELGMTTVRPNQIILPQQQDMEPGLSNALAMADSEVSALKISATRTPGSIPAN
jgi:cell division protein FtsL